MHEHHEDDPEVLSEIEKLGYDPRDVPVEQTPKHAIGMFLAFGVMMALAALIMWIVDRMSSSASLGTQPIVERRNMPEYPYPLVQSNKTAKTDIHDLRAQENAKTDHVSWVDQEKGTVRIPIEQAMQNILEEGLPVTTSQGAPASVTGEDPSAPGTAVESTEFRAGSRNMATTGGGN